MQSALGAFAFGLETGSEGAARFSGISQKLQRHVAIAYGGGIVHETAEVAANFLYAFVREELTEDPEAFAEAADGDPKVVNGLFVPIPRSMFELVSEGFKQCSNAVGAVVAHLLSVALPIGAYSYGVHGNFIEKS